MGIAWKQQKQQKQQEQTNQKEQSTGTHRSLLKVLSFKAALAAGILSLSPLAAAECACFCADGELKTMCTTVAEAQANPAVCPVYAASSCPLSSAAAGSNRYDAPAEGATNCRDVQVWDSVRGRYVDVKACDVEG